MKVFRRPAVWLGVAVSVGALALATRGLQFSEVWDALRHAEVYWFAPAFVALLLGFYVRALRWRLLYPPGTRLQTENLFGAMNVGYMLNNLLPLRVGEIGRAYVIGEVEDVSRIQSMCTIVVERLLDVLVLIALLLVLLPFVDEPGWATGPALALGAVAITLAATLTIIGRARDVVRRIAERIIQRVAPGASERLVFWLDAALGGFETLSNPSLAIRASAWSVAAWGLSSLYIYAMLMAFNVSLAYSAPLFVMVALNLGMVVPSSSGYLGVYHAIAIETLTVVFGVDRAQAAGFALASHAMFYVTPIALGGFYLWNRRTLWERLLSGRWSRTASPVTPETPLPSPASVTVGAEQ